MSAQAIGVLCATACHADYILLCCDVKAANGRALSRFSVSNRVSTPIFVSLNEIKLEVINVGTFGSAWCVDTW